MAKDHGGGQSHGSHETRQKGVLFTAFEPSGDALAAPVICELRKRYPEMPIYAWGGAKMREAGAELIQETVSEAEMAVVSLGKIKEHLAINKRIRTFIRARWIGAHVAVDSPAANFPICKITRKAGCRVLHLAAPQIWAWASWRIRKLRKRTDMVLCLLPFEEAYFRERGVPAKFIGHPIFSRELDEETIQNQAQSLPHGSPKMVFLPGSRPHEVTSNIKPMVNAFAELKGLDQNAVGVIVAVDDSIASLIHRKVRDLPGGLFVVTDRLHGVLRWAEIGVLCSGTATLDATRFRLPMVVLYRINPIAWYLAAKWLIRTPFFALPNLIAGREVVPEFVPYFGRCGAIVKQVREFVEDSRLPASQKQALDSIGTFFENVDPAVLACDEIIKMMELATA